MASQLELFVAKWRAGCGSSICSGARHICLARGKVPCEVLFVGEAPGESEDAIGKPMVGPAGKLFDKLLQRSIDRFRLCAACRRGNVLRRFPSGESSDLCSNGHGESDSEPVRYAITNLTCCIPREGGGGKAAEPSSEDIKCCSQRLREFVALCKPKLIVAVGSLARDWLDPHMRDCALAPPTPKGSRLLPNKQANAPRSPLLSIEQVSVLHPAYLLRARVAERGLLIQRTIVTISNAVEEMLEERQPTISQGPMPSNNPLTPLFLGPDESGQYTEEDIPF